MSKLTYLPAQPFAGGVHRFELGAAQIIELETGRTMRTGLRQVGVVPKPIYATFAGIMSGRLPDADGGTIGNPFASQASAIDIQNVVRLGLEGGGMDAGEAARLVRENSPPHKPMSELWDIAAALVYAHIEGVEQDEQASA